MGDVLQDGVGGEAPINHGGWKLKSTNVGAEVRRGDVFSGEVEEEYEIKIAV